MAFKGFNLKKTLLLLKIHVAEFGSSLQDLLLGLHSKNPAAEAGRHHM